MPRIIAAIAMGMLIVGCPGEPPGLSDASCATEDAPFVATECMSSEGARLCGTGACRCAEDTIDVACFAGVCIDAANASDGPLSCPDGLLNVLSRPPSFDGRGAWCAGPAACREFARGASEWRCYYSDGTAFEAAPRGCGDCGELETEGLCGRGCRGCPADEGCFGPSEVSPVGVCLGRDAADPRYFLHEPCGPLPDGSVLRCPEGRACLRFASPSAPELGGIVPGACIGSARCLAIAAARPDRFGCTD